MVSNERFPIQEVREPTRSFVRESANLPQRMQAQLERAIRELLEDRVPPGRHLESVTNLSDVYSMRLNDSYRFVFAVDEDGVADPVAVGQHDQAYERARRRR